MPGVGKLVMVRRTVAAAALQYIAPNTQRLTPRERGCVLTIGNFDGFHLGHQSILARAKHEAVQRAVPLVALIFHPHPRQVLRSEEVPLISTLGQRQAWLQEAGVDEVFILSFSHELSQWSAEKFVAEVMVSWLRCCALVVGQGFALGHRRAGNADVLTQLGTANQFVTIFLPPVNDGDGRISSSRVRQLLQAGEITKVEKLLGRPPGWSGVVGGGDQRGRQIGFPTANLQLENGILYPRQGVYAGFALLPHGGKTMMVANIGRRPTFAKGEGGSAPLFEVHLLDFSGDLYGQDLRVELKHWLRPEAKFAGTEELKAQIAADIVVARQKLTKNSI